MIEAKGEKTGSSSQVKVQTRWPNMFVSVNMPMLATHKLQSWKLGLDQAIPTHRAAAHANLAQSFIEIMRVDCRSFLKITGVVGSLQSFHERFQEEGKRCVHQEMQEALRTNENGWREQRWTIWLQDWATNKEFPVGFVPVTRTAPQDTQAGRCPAWWRGPALSSQM